LAGAIGAIAKDLQRLLDARLGGGGEVLGEQRLHGCRVSDVAGAEVR
jgi:hypothetical protein